MSPPSDAGPPSPTCHLEDRQEHAEDDMIQLESTLLGRGYRNGFAIPKWGCESTLGYQVSEGPSQGFRLEPSLLNL